MEGSDKDHEVGLYHQIAEKWGGGGPGGVGVLLVEGYRLGIFHKSSTKGGFMDGLVEEGGFKMGVFWILFGLDYSVAYLR